MAYARALELDPGSVSAHHRLLIEYRAQIARVLAHHRLLIEYRAQIARSTPSQRTQTERTPLTPFVELLCENLVIAETRPHVFSRSQRLYVYALAC